MKKLSKEEIKSIQLEMLSYIDNICKKNNIKYSLIGGSLIGAIRHKGMIPWDDDIDIGLVYDEYIKLINVLRKSDDYILLDHDRNKKYYFPFVKMVDKSTQLIEKDFSKIDEYGVYIDIFCYRKVPSGKKAKKYYNKQQYYNFMLGGIKEVNKDKNVIRYLSKLLRYYYVHMMGVEHYFNQIKKLYKKYETIESKYLLADWHVYPFENEIKTVDMFDDYIQVPFENLKVSIIKKYDIYLKSTFHNYMELPPEEKRVTHDLTVYLRER